MNNLFVLGSGGALLALAIGTPASAITLVGGSCAAISGPNGCLFNGLISAANTASVQAQFNLFNNTHPSAGANVNLNYLFKSTDGAGFPGVVTGTTSGSWSVTGYNIRYLAVSAGPDSVLYRISPQASSGGWSTVDIPHGASLREVRNLVFFGSAVPEPSTWLTFIAGLGMTGWVMRRRSQRAIVSARRLA